MEKWLEQGIQQGIEQGIQQGIQQGLLEGIEALIEIKFGERGLKLVPDIRKILDLFILYAREKEIRIDFLEDNSFTFWFDYDKLEKIMSNLLSNAIKHTEKEGTIEVNLRNISGDLAKVLNNSNLKMQVADYVEINTKKLN